MKTYMQFTMLDHMSKPFRVFFSHGAMPTALKSRVFSTESLESGMNHLHAVKSEGQERFSIMEELKEPPHQSKFEFGFVEKPFSL